jgi:hypothetical protein
MDNATLDELGLKYRTDKSSGGHNYLALYERYFAPIRGEKVKILEIGVLNGASLAVWEEYFPNGTVIGADINNAVRRFARPRVEIAIIDQSDIEQLVQLGLKHGPFDVIIEDGSHFWDHQITSLKTLFPFVKNGGIYIVEDLQTNYGRMEATYRGVASISCAEYLKKLVDLRVAGEQIDIAAEEDAFLRSYGRSINTITFCRHACIIEKSVPDMVEASAGDPLVAVDQDDSVIPVFIFAHIGNQGDRTNPIGWMRSLNPADHIQAFSIETLADTGCEIQYRACLADGSWTGWKTRGELAGTRGESAGLTGFSARPGNRGFALEVVGEFADAAEPVTVQGGEDCLPPQGAGALTGMQIVLRRGG